MNSKVIVCGQAKSHSVNYTVRDLMSVWPSYRMVDLVLLSDCSSPMAGCEKLADELEDEMRVAGCTVCTAQEFMR